MKRMISVLLTALMLSAIVACNATDAPEAESGETAKEDFFGVEFILRDGATTSGADFLPKYGDNEQSDRMLDRFKEIQDTYNCVFTVEMGTIEEVTRAYASWLHYADLVNFRNYNTYKLYSAGYVLPLEEIPTIDIHSGKYGSEKLLDCLRWKDETVAFWPAYWGIPLPSFSDALMYNPRLIAEYNLSDPQELFEQGQWNWENYEQMARGVAEGGYNEAETPVYFSCFDAYTVRLAMYSNGGALITKSENGKYEFTLDTPQNRRTMEWLRTLVQIDSFMTWTGNNDDTNAKFYNGEMLFFPEYSVTGLKMSGGSIGVNMGEEWRYCYYPIGPDGTKEDIERSRVSIESRFITPLTLTEDESTLGTFMELLFEPLYDTPDGWRDSFLNINFFDSFSQDYYMTKWDNINNDYSTFVKDFNGILYSIVYMERGSNGYVKKAGSFSSLVESYGDKIQLELDEIINN